MSTDERRLFLGLDASTQSLSAVALEVDVHGARVVWEHTLRFDDALPHYGTVGGVLPSDDPAIAVAPPHMWRDGVLLMLAAFAESGLPLDCLAGLSGCAQQHGTVYLAADGTFTRERSPIWRDTSTHAQCRAIEAAVGGGQVLAAHTGSRAFERFAGPQIRKFAETEPASYARTSRIHLISSWLASVLVDGDAPIDPGDGSGMNLMDLDSSSWWSPAVAATAPGLDRRLPPIVASHTVVGVMADVWRRQYGLPAAPVVAWTGDNPSSLIGLGLCDERVLAVSLGTSDTVFGVMTRPRVDPDGTGHVFGAPTGDYMGITVFANGSLTREHLRDQYGLTWAGFSEALQATMPEATAGLMYPWLVPEITPPVHVPGVRRLGLDEADAPQNVRALVEGQMMSHCLFSRWMGVTPTRIVATGGASANLAMLQVMADVWQRPVEVAPDGASAALGSALRAWHGVARMSSAPLGWDEVLGRFTRPSPRVIEPRREYAAVYQSLLTRYAAGVPQWPRETTPSA